MSLVLELQEGIYNNRYSTVEVLRKAYVISRKLGINSISEWLNSEMNGYKKSELPNYRKISGVLKAWNPYHGWQPIDLEENLRIVMSFLEINHSIEELETLLGNKGNDIIAWKTNDTDNIMSKLKTKVRIETTVSQIKNILGTVNNKVLDWTLDLENKGVLGEGMTFSKEEKEKAMNITINGANNSPIQIQTNNSSQEVSYGVTQENLEIIKDKINELEEILVENLRLSDDLKVDLDSIKLQLNKEKPNKNIIKSMLAATSEGISNIPKAVEIFEAIMGYFG